jgi:hypothetical protein
MFKKDILLTKSHDLAIENFDLRLTSDEEAVGQRLKQTLLLFKGEWFLDQDIGVPYYGDILGTKNSIDAIRAVLINAIQDVEGVKEIVEFSLAMNDATRILDIKISVIDDLDNQVNIDL